MAENGDQTTVESGELRRFLIGALAVLLQKPGVDRALKKDDAEGVIKAAHGAHPAVAVYALESVAQRFDETRARYVVEAIAKGTRFPQVHSHAVEYLAYHGGMYEAANLLFEPHANPAVNNERRKTARELWGRVNSGALPDPKATDPRDAWIRSRTEQRNVRVKVLTLALFLADPKQPDRMREVAKEAAPLYEIAEAAVRNGTHGEAIEMLAAKAREYRAFPTMSALALSQRCTKECEKLVKEGLREAAVTWDVEINLTLLRAGTDDEKRKGETAILGILAFGTPEASLYAAKQLVRRDAPESYREVADKARSRWFNSKGADLLRASEHAEKLRPKIDEQVHGVLESVFQRKKHDEIKQDHRVRRFIGNLPENAGGEGARARQKVA